MNDSVKVNHTHENVDRNRFSLVSCSFVAYSDKGILLTHALLPNTTVNAIYYRNILEHCLCVPHCVISDNISCSQYLLSYTTMLAVALSMQWVMLFR